MTCALSVDSTAITTTRTKTETMYVHVTIVCSMNGRSKKMSNDGTGYVGIDKNYFVGIKEVLNITAETGAWETQTRVKKLQPADVVEVRHGHWIRGRKIHGDIPNDSDYEWECSECYHTDVHNEKVQVDYCWHCGARMDGKEQEHE